MFRRLHLPALQQLSRWIRASIVVFYGVCGLPIPFRQRLMYVIGSPIAPTPVGAGTITEEQAVERMQQQFCDELLRIFERNKDSYGWHHKTLKLLKL